MNNYILIGIPDCGKSTLGRRAAEVLGMNFCDTDDLAEERASAKRRLLPMSMASAALLAEEENNVTEELLKTAKLSIIATGAEVPLSARNISILKKLGTVIYIKRDPDIIIADIRENKLHSLILENMNSHKTINIRECAVTQYAECRSDYEAVADISLDNNGSEEAGLEQLVTIIRKIEGKRSGSGGGVR